MLAKHNINSIALPPKKISNYLPLVKDGVGLRTPGMYSIPCELLDKEVDPYNQYQTAQQMYKTGIN
jgi:hypothetical protein